MLPLYIRVSHGVTGHGTEAPAPGARETGPAVSLDGRCGGTLAVHPHAPPESTPRMKQLIALSAIGSDRTGMVHDLTRVIADCGGNIVESHMSALGSEFVMALLISGNWHSLAKIETEIKKLADTNVSLEGVKAQQFLKLVEALDDHDDVQNVWANFDIDAKLLEVS